MDIETRSLRSLEWDKLKRFLSLEAETRGGRALALALTPADNPATAHLLLDETEEAHALIGARSGFSLDALPEMSEILTRLRAFAVLSAAELSQLRTQIVLSRTVKRGLTLLAAESFPRLKSYLKDMHVQEAVLARIDEAIDPSGGIKDDASPHLQSLRKEVRRLDGSIKDELTRIINSSTLSKALQEPIYTQRSGRYVLPVEASKRNVIQGIVHDSSASGLTVYVEPMSVVELANKLRIKEAEIEHEIVRILTKISDAARSEIDGLESSYATLIDLDLIFARARLATKYGGTRPELGRDGKDMLSLKEARHPLLVLQRSRDEVVANDIELRNDQRALVITGPNTGGKTVLLKTIGLFSIMVKAGFMLPAKSGSNALFFKEIYADIGDEQSLEQSLSTFSSHMTGIVEIVERAGPGVLVLLDEVGAGTDPVEGAAIARAVLEHLNESGAVTVATTHLGELKTLAYNKKGFLNGSLAFDDATLSPTYRLRLGIPGSSKGITISKRLGLSGDVVEKALSYLDKGTQDLDATVEKLTGALADAEDMKEKAELELALSQKAKDEYEEKLDRLTREAVQEREAASRTLESELEAARDLIKSITRDLQKQPALKRAQSAQEELAALRRELGWMDEEKSKKSDSQKFTIGDDVKIRSLNQRGTIEAVRDAQGEETDAEYTVRAGILKIKVHASDLEAPGAKTVPDKARSKKSKELAADSSRSRGSSAGSGRARASHERAGQVSVFVRTSSNTLDLRGERVEPGLARLERFIDESIVSATSPLMIIHGHGTGAMKSAVRDYLSSLRDSLLFRPGEMHEGGDGVTVVEI